MKNYFLIAALTLGMLPAFGQSVIDFEVDPGIRINGGTTRKAVFKDDTLFLYYGYNLWDGTNLTPVSELAIATDAPDYVNFTTVPLDSFPKYNLNLLPDGITRRGYGLPMGQNYLTSSSTTDWYTVTPDSGIRYYLHPSDSATFGVSTTITDSVGDVHIYYMGAMPPGGANNIRHCISTDGGDNFTFVSNDVCGDLSGPGGNRSHVDPDAVVLTNGDIRMMTMNANGTVVPISPTQTTNFAIYSFLSTDNGATFTQEVNSMGGDMMVHSSDFADTSVHSLHDPKIVELPDGRIKVFMNGSCFDPTDSLRWNIFSITSVLPTNTETASPVSFTVFPNPVGDVLRIRTDAEVATLEVRDLRGRLLREAEGKEVAVGDLAPGLYLLRLRTRDGAVAVRKFIRSGD